MLALAYRREIAKQLRRYPIVVSITGVFAIFVFVVTVMSMLSSENRRAGTDVDLPDLPSADEMPLPVSDIGSPVAEAPARAGGSAPDPQRAANLPETSLALVRPREAFNTAPTTSSAKPGNVDLVPQDHSGDYTVQVGSFRREQSAKGLLQLLKNRGYPVFLQIVRIPDKGTTHRVRVGTFRNRDQARRFGEALREKEGFIENIFVTVRN